MKLTVYILLSIILWFLSLHSSDAFFDYSISFLDTSNTAITYVSLISQFRHSRLFAISIGMLPLLLLFVQKKATLKKVEDSLKALAIILVCGFVAWALRIVQLSIQLQSLNNLHLSNELEYSYDAANLFFEVYLLIGFFIGAILCIYVFNKKIN